MDKLNNIGFFYCFASKILPLINNNMFIRKGIRYIVIFKFRFKFVIVWLYCIADFAGESGNSVVTNEISCVVFF